jgi:cytidylate kinase
MKKLIVAIDGPSGAGKGTVARAVAARLGYRHIDTGALYRAVALKARRQGVDPGDEVATTGVAASAAIEVGDGIVRLDGEDVALAIRTPEIDAAAAAVARLQGVRAVLIEAQRTLGRGGGVVMEGRDIGTVVFPEAEVKIYLDAAPEERARRRAHDPAHSAGRGRAAVQEVATALAARDRSDSTRPVAPLARAADAVIIDTTGLAIDEVVARVLTIVDRAR